MSRPKLIDGWSDAMTGEAWRLVLIPPLSGDEGESGRLIYERRDGLDALGVERWERVAMTEYTGAREEVERLAARLEVVATELSLCRVQLATGLYCEAQADAPSLKPRPKPFRVARVRPLPNGKLVMCNHAEKGFASFGYEYAGWLELLSAWDVVPIEIGEDEHSPYVDVGARP